LYRQARSGSEQNSQALCTFLQLQQIASKHISQQAPAVTT
jgi:hypothetical protein